MGEAKRRKFQHPYFGKFPKAGKGIVISSPIKVGESGGVLVTRNDLDPYELRRAVLFWDRIQWPKGLAFYVEGSASEVDYLSEVGVISRPYHDDRFPSSEQYLEGHFQVFVDNEPKEPCQWSISEGPSSFIF